MKLNDKYNLEYTNNPERITAEKKLHDAVETNQRGAEVSRERRVLFDNHARPTEKVRKSKGGAYHH